MYHPDIIAERLDAAEAQLGWRPVYHSVEEVDLVNRRLDAIAVRDEEGKFTGETLRQYTDSEKWWIRNERILCACDASYFATRYAYIKDEKNNVKRFAFRDPQRVYFEVIAELERRGAAIQIAILKARQLGMSTLSEILVAHRIFFTYGVNAVIASADQQKTGIMSQMIFLVYDRLPYWMQPSWTRRVESDKGMLVFGGIQSGVSFQHGAQTSGIARGTTPTVCHLSEVASYTNPDETIESSLFRAVHESPNVFFILESTAEGVENWWHKQWKISKTGWHKGKARFYPLFLPWFIGTDMYPTVTWLNTRPIDEGWVPSKETKSMIAKAKMYVHNDPILRKVMGDDWELPREQAWFWEVNFEEAKGRGREKLWNQEMPCDDLAAFQGSYDSVFGNDIIEELHEERKKDYEVYAITGHGIEEKFHPDPEEEDLSEKAVRKLVHYVSNKGPVYKWELRPIRREVIEDTDIENLEKAEEQADCKLLVFHHPEEGYDYAIGVDTGAGVGLDYTSIEVWRKGTRGMPDVHCAEFASAYVSHVECYSFIMAIAAYYAKYMRGSIPKEPLVSIEQIAAVGDIAQPQMRLMGYGRFHLFHDYDSKRIKKKKSNKMGWRTGPWSRPILIDSFVHSVKNSWAIIHSPFLLREMSKFEVHTRGGKERLEHSDGEHDDRIFSSAIAIFTSHDMEAMVERGKNKPVSFSQSYRPNVSLEPIGGHTIPTSLDRLSSMLVRAKTTQDIEDLMADERLGY